MPVGQDLGATSAPPHPVPSQPEPGRLFSATRPLAEPMGMGVGRISSLNTSLN